MLTGQLIFDITAPLRDGLLTDFASQQTTRFSEFIRQEGLNRSIRLVQPSAAATRIWDDIDLTGAYLALAIGLSDQPPLTGTFPLTYAADGTGLGALAYNVSAATLQAALNANPTIAAIPDTVVVTQNGQNYIIQFQAVGVRSLIATAANSLEPESSVTISRVETGGAATKEVQVMRVVQKPYAMNDVWTGLPVAAAVITQLQVGDAGNPSIQRVTFSPSPYDGTWFVTGGISTPIPYNATGTTASNATTGWTVVRSGNFSWDFTNNANGAQAALVVDVSGLSVPLGVQGSLNLNTFGMYDAFANADTDPIELTLELLVQFPGLLPYVVYREDVSVYKNVIDLGTMIPTPIPAGFRSPWGVAPANSGSAGVAGAEAYDFDFYYICVAANTWHRVALAAF